MGKRKTAIPQEDTSINTTPVTREKRVKRKRYNSDDYILDDQDFLKVQKIIEAPSPSSSSMPQLIRTPKAQPKYSSAGGKSPNTSIGTEKISPSSLSPGRHKKNLSPQKPTVVVLSSPQKKLKY